MVVVWAGEGGGEGGGGMSSLRHYLPIEWVSPVFQSVECTLHDISVILLPLSALVDIS